MPSRGQQSRGGDRDDGQTQVEGCQDGGLTVFQSQKHRSLSLNLATTEYTLQTTTGKLNVAKLLNRVEPLLILTENRFLMLCPYFLYKRELSLLMVIALNQGMCSLGFFVQ